MEDEKVQYSEIRVAELRITIAQKTPVKLNYSGRLPAFITTAQTLQLQIPESCCALNNYISVSLSK
jgi:hypothetical protein